VYFAEQHVHPLVPAVQDVYGVKFFLCGLVYIHARLARRERKEIQELLLQKF
jgi:hypothetical protein